MDNINLDITTYSIEEMERLLKLKPLYNGGDLFINKTKSVTNIIQSKITEIKKEELLIFLDNIYNKLSNNLVKIDTTNFNDVKQYDGNHFIIKNENNNYSSTLENNKKVNKSIIKRTYTIDSLFRQNYEADNNQSHNYIITLPETINKVITMSVGSLEIPLTYYNISNGLNNNAFKITIVDQNNNPTDISSLIILRSGLYEARYNTTESLNRAQNIVTEINENDNFVQFNTDISNSYGTLLFGLDNNSGLSIFKFTPSSSDFFDISYYKVEIDFDVNNNENTQCLQNKLYQKLGWQLGFRTNKLIIDSSANFPSLNICYINYPRYLYIAIDDFQTSSRNYFSIASNSIIAPNIIGRINILSLLEEKSAFKQAAAPGDFIYSQKFLREYFGPTSINKLKISLLDEYGRPFSLNNMEWSFILSFECFYN